MTRIACGSPTLPRRAFLGGLAGAALLPGRVARAASRPRRVAFIHSIAGDEPTVVAQILAFEASLAAAGWTIGSDLVVDYRFAEGTVERMGPLARELVARSPDVIVAVSTPVALAVREVSGGIPVVFYPVTDPVGAGLVETLDRPGGTFTGFTLSDSQPLERWINLMVQVVPDLGELTLVYNPSAAAGFVNLFLAAAPAIGEAAGLTLYALTIEDEAAIPATIAQAAGPGRGLVVLPDAFTHAATRRRAIIDAAATNRLPAIYPFPEFVTDGGLMAHSVDMVTQAAAAGEYVDRILRGESPADLPVVPPTGFVLMVNPAAAAALGLSFPDALLAQATVIGA